MAGPGRMRVNRKVTRPKEIGLLLPENEFPLQTLNTSSEPDASAPSAGADAARAKMTTPTSAVMTTAVAGTAASPAESQVTR